MAEINIIVGKVAIRCRTFDTPTARAIVAALPIEGKALTWGDEVYFTIPVGQPREAAAKALVKAGEIAYWPDGEAIAIGFGRTPISGPGEIRLASPCNIWAEAIDDVTLLKPARQGDLVRVELA